MKKYLLLLSFVFGLNLSANAQLADGSIAPDFTLTDRDGTVHNLYQYLDQGKVVFIKFFACHCPACWSYHNSGKLEDINQTYGPTGTDQIVVIMLEHDVNNEIAFSGGGTYTQGDWEAGNSIPMVDVEGNDRSVFDDYNLNYYPMVIKVCSDKTTELMSTGDSTADLFQAADACAGTLSTDIIEEKGTINLDRINKQLFLKGLAEVQLISIYNLRGQKVLSVAADTNNSIDLSSLTKGIYVVHVEHSNGLFSEKILLD
jgi:thiol-disulfide isomerase/thioredoxin